MTPSTPKLTQGKVPNTLVKMALPMLGGTFALNAFNLTDTWFVAQLGTLPLAAMGFSFPVVPKGEARIRVQLSAAHTREQLDKALSVFEDAGKSVGAI